MISTRDLSQMLNIDDLRRLFQSMAMLDAIIPRDWESRYYSFNAHWGDGEQLGSIRNGQGDEFFAVFNTQGFLLKGFAHESPMSPYRQVKKIFGLVFWIQFPTSLTFTYVTPHFLLEIELFVFGDSPLILNGIMGRSCIRAVMILTVLNDS